MGYAFGIKTVWLASNLQQSQIAYTVYNVISQLRLCRQFGRKNPKVIIRRKGIRIERFLSNPIAH